MNRMIDKNTPAFPQKRDNDGGGTIQYFGLSKREYTAIEAMKGMLSTESETEGYYSMDEKSRAILVKKSYAIADSMIAESEKDE